MTDHDQNSKMAMNTLSHLSPAGEARMVDVGAKPLTRRTAKASALVTMRPETAERIQAGNLPKGDVLGTARLAGIMAAKRTHELIPLCHPLPLDSVDVQIAFISATEARIVAVVRATWRTGVEMEALTAVSIAALTLYDMSKAIDKGMIIGPIALLSKTGGKSGDYIVED